MGAHGGTGLLLKELIGPFFFLFSLRNLDRARRGGGAEKKHGLANKNQGHRQTEIAYM
jgi:hypothetical protein